MVAPVLETVRVALLPGVIGFEEKAAFREAAFAAALWTHKPLS